MLTQQKCPRTTDFMTRLADDSARAWVDNVIAAIRKIYNNVDIWPTGGRPTRDNQRMYVDLRMGKKNSQKNMGKPVYNLWIGKRNRPQLWLRENYRDDVLPRHLNEVNAPLQQDIETWLKSHKNLIFQLGADLEGGGFNPDAFLPKNSGGIQIQKSTPLPHNSTNLDSDELVDEYNEAIEGQSKDYIVTKASRNQEIVKKRKEKDKYACQACGFKLKIDGIYIIDCHHINPLSDSGETITSINDLVCLCPTCHRVAHTKKVPLSVDKIKEVLSGFPEESEDDNK